MVERVANVKEEGSKGSKGSKGSYRESETAEKMRKTKCRRYTTVSYRIFFGLVECKGVGDSKRDCECDYSI